MPGQRISVGLPYPSFGPSFSGPGPDPRQRPAPDRVPGGVQPGSDVSGGSPEGPVDDIGDVRQSGLRDKRVAENRFKTRQKFAHSRYTMYRKRFGAFRTDISPTVATRLDRAAFIRTEKDFFRRYGDDSTNLASLLYPKEPPGWMDAREDRAQGLDGLAPLLAQKARESKGAGDSGYTLHSDPAWGGTEVGRTATPVKDSNVAARDAHSWMPFEEDFGRRQQTATARQSKEQQWHDRMKEFRDRYHLPLQESILGFAQMLQQGAPKLSMPDSSQAQLKAPPAGGPF